MYSLPPPHSCTIAWGSEPTFCLATPVVPRSADGNGLSLHPCCWLLVPVRGFGLYRCNRRHGIHSSSSARPGLSKGCGKGTFGPHPVEAGVLDQQLVMRVGCVVEGPEHLVAKAGLLFPSATEQSAVFCLVLCPIWRHLLQRNAACLLCYCSVLGRFIGRFSTEAEPNPGISVFLEVQTNLSGKMRCLSGTVGLRPQKHSIRREWVPFGFVSGQGGHTPFHTVGRKVFPIPAEGRRCCRKAGSDVMKE